jgi:hypothetical protein
MLGRSKVTRSWVATSRLAEVDREQDPGDDEKRRPEVDAESRVDRRQCRRADRVKEEALADGTLEPSAGCVVSVTDPPT